MELEMSEDFVDVVDEVDMVDSVNNPCCPLCSQGPPSPQRCPKRHTFGWERRRPACIAPKGAKKRRELFGSICSLVTMLESTSLVGPRCFSTTLRHPDFIDFNLIPIRKPSADSCLDKWSRFR